MGIRFVGIDPDTPGNQCPAVFIDEETGDILFQGTTETDPEILAEVARHSPIADHESVVRLPERMRAIILEACLGSEVVQRVDSRHPVERGSSGDA